jgi:hypothetical protein
MIQEMDKQVVQVQVVGKVVLLQELVLAVLEQPIKVLQVEVQQHLPQALLQVAQVVVQVK